MNVTENDYLGGYLYSTFSFGEVYRRNDRKSRFTFILKKGATFLRFAFDRSR